ncbi:HEAT repeat domain-containing protein [uncultured Hydrogenophaga sp.]|uniref:HEAT repeat domain-containing protein n=1 Tax=uncultured Hydrogenophaga sp. TaxID=199683 RepID=UPI00265ED5F0|nr:HEAT repeat domain-containing protein [uncultured Hydrogenophaga sp.]
MGLKRTGPAPDATAPPQRPMQAVRQPAELGAGTAAERREAARELSRRPDTSDAIGAQLLTEPDASVREALFTGLRHQASAGAAAALIGLLSSEDAGLRNGAIEALSAMPEAVAPRMKALLRDTDPDVRIFAVNLLVELQHPDLVVWLVDALAQETQVNVVAAAIDVLAEVGGPEQHPLLRGLAARFPDDPFIGFAVDMALSRSEAA